MAYDKLQARDRLKDWLKFPPVSSHGYLELSKSEGKVLTAVYWSLIQPICAERNMTGWDKMPGHVQRMLGPYYSGTLSGSEGRLIEDAPWCEIIAQFSRISCSGSEYRIYEQPYFTYHPEEADQCLGTHRLSPMPENLDNILSPAIHKMLFPEEPLVITDIPF